MTPTTFDRQQPHQHAFAMRSGRIICVDLRRCVPMHDDELRVGFTPRQIQSDGSPVLDANNQPITGTEVCRGLHRSGLVTRSISLKPAFFRRWRTMPRDSDWDNVTVPDMAAGQTLEYGGDTWHAGVGVPDDGMGEEKHFYLDKSTGNVYRKRVGDLAYLAGLTAQQFDEHLSLDAEIDALGVLPE